MLTLLFSISLTGLFSAPISAMSRAHLLIGGNSGIEIASARLLLPQGDSLVAAARPPDPLAALGIRVQHFDAIFTAPLELPPVLDGLVYFPGSITLKPFHASIAAAKGAVEGLAPSLTDTPLAGTLLNSDAKREATAKLVAFLLSDAARFMTGLILRPDGGLSSIRTF